MNNALTLLFGTPIAFPAKMISVTLTAELLIWTHPATHPAPMPHAITPL